MSEFYALTEQTADKVAEWRDELPGEPVAKKPRRDNSGMAFVRITSTTVTAGTQPAEVIYLDTTLAPVAMGNCRYRDLMGIPVPVGQTVLTRFAGVDASNVPIYAGDPYSRNFAYVHIEPCGTTTNEPIMRAGRVVQPVRGSSLIIVNRRDLTTPGAVWVQGRINEMTRGGYASGSNPLSDYYVFMCEQIGFFTDGKPVFMPVQCSLNALVRGPIAQGTMLVFGTWTLPNGKVEEGWYRLQPGQPGQVLTIGTLASGFNSPFWAGTTTPTVCPTVSGVTLAESPVFYNP